MYALYIHNKHDTDWSDKSYHKIMIFDDTKFNQFTNGLNYYNTKIVINGNNTFKFSSGKLYSENEIYVSGSITNYNYLNSDNISTWLLNAYEKNTYEVLYLNKRISKVNANDSNSINPVIYLSRNVIIKNGNGTQIKPFTIK